MRMTIGRGARAVVILAIGAGFLFTGCADPMMGSDSGMMKDQGTMKKDGEMMKEEKGTMEKKP